MLLSEPGIMQSLVTVLFKHLALETPFPSACPSQVICAAGLREGKGRDGTGGDGTGRDGKGGGRGSHSPHPSNQKQEPEAVTPVEEGQV